MGISTGVLKFLSVAKKEKTNFATTCFIGRQENYCSKNDLKLSTKYLNLNLDLEFLSSEKWFDNIFKEIFSSYNIFNLDSSNHENANLIHDLNESISEKYINKFDCVIDSGSIEHIFNIPKVLENYSKMLKKNGSLFIMTNANNSCGHGFYQFSPDFFYSIFNETNGFKINKLVIESYNSFGNRRLFNKYYELKYPEKLKERIILKGKDQLDVMCHITKINDHFSFKKITQTNYLFINKKNSSFIKENITKPKFLTALKKYFPNFVIIIYEYFVSKNKYSIKSKKNFKSWNPY